MPPARIVGDTDALLGCFVDEAGQRYVSRAEIGRGVLTTVSAADRVVGEDEPPPPIPRVAIKTILPLWVGHPLAEARIARERELSAELHRTDGSGDDQQPSCARILTGGRQPLPDGRNRPFHVSPLYDGMTLGQRLRLATAAPGGGANALGPELVLAWADDLLLALGRLHRAGWVHRDVKPQNIFLVDPVAADTAHEERSRAALIDYGLAVRIAAVDHDGDEPFGTPAYVSPEVVAGAPLDGRADLYSLGLVLFELLAHQRPFPTRDPIELVEAHLSLPAPPLRLLCPALSVELERVIGATLAKAPGERPATASELAASLRATPEARTH